METVGLNFARLFDGAFYGKKVLVTGDTGFKGSWLSLWLYLMGARVYGYALAPVCAADNFTLCALDQKITDIRGDIRDREHLKAVFDTYQPELVFHLAAQPIVRLSYELPAETLETNIMGTVNVLECIRTSENVLAGVIVTSDKCYENREQLWGYREDDAMGGFDPYSASKGCAELVTAAYRNSFPRKVLSSARAGNVVGGGDWSTDRILPDCVRALESGRAVDVRNPYAVRPWQFVLEPLYGYLLLASKLLGDSKKYAGAWNFGPESDSIVPVKELVESAIRIWGSGKWNDLSAEGGVHEASLLNLDCTKAKILLGWKPRLTLDETLEWTLEWYKAYKSEDVCQLCERQIKDYCLKGHM